MKITHVDDYIKILKKLFPTISESDIKKIITYGWKQFYLLNSYGGDVFILDYDLWLYSGRLTFDSLKFFKYYIRKLKVKLRVLYKRKKIKWNGYYYFALSEKLYNSLMALKSKRGRPKKIFNYGTVIAYKIFDECKINEFNKKYIFRIPYSVELGFTMLLLDLKTDKAELIDTHEIFTFKDILINNNKYEYI